MAAEKQATAGWRHSRLEGQSSREGELGRGVASRQGGRTGGGRWWRRRRFGWWRRRRTAEGEGEMKGCRRVGVDGHECGRRAARGGGGRGGSCAGGTRRRQALPEKKWGVAVQPPSGQVQSSSVLEPLGWRLPKLTRSHSHAHLQVFPTANLEYNQHMYIGCIYSTPCIRSACLVQCSPANMYDNRWSGRR